MSSFNLEGVGFEFLEDLSFFTSKAQVLLLELLECFLQLGLLVLSESFVASLMELRQNRIV